MAQDKEADGSACVQVAVALTVGSVSRRIGGGGGVGGGGVGGRTG